MIGLSKFTINSGNHDQNKNLKNTKNINLKKAKLLSLEMKPIHFEAQTSDKIVMLI